MKQIALFTLLIYSNCLFAKDEVVIRGTSSSDRLVGTPGSDVIYGGEGDDRIEGGRGADVIYGGLGADLFVIDLDETSLVDTIMDFNTEEGDRIALNFSGERYEQIKQFIPGFLTSKHFSLDNRGNLIMRIGNEKPKRLLNIKKTDLVLSVEDKGRSVYIRFTKNF